MVVLSAWLRDRPPALACVAIDIPIGLLDGSRACDKAARKLLGQPRGSSVFPTPCRAALRAQTYAEASSTNRQKTTRGLSQQAWRIAPKIKQVDDAITSDCQRWAFEVHPEVCFWALAEERPMAHRKKTKAGVSERLDLLRPVFPDIEHFLQNRPRNGVQGFHFHSESKRREKSYFGRDTEKLYAETSAEWRAMDRNFAGDILQKARATLLRSREREEPEVAQTALPLMDFDPGQLDRNEILRRTADVLSAFVGVTLVIVGTPE